MSLNARASSLHATPGGPRRQPLRLAAPCAASSRRAAIPLIFQGRAGQRRAARRRRRPRQPQGALQRPLPLPLRVLPRPHVHLPGEAARRRALPLTRWATPRACESESALSSRRFPPRTRTARGTRQDELLRHGSHRLHRPASRRAAARARRRHPRARARGLRGQARAPTRRLRQARRPPEAGQRRHLRAVPRHVRRGQAGAERRRALLPPRRDLRHDGRRRGAQPAPQRPRHPERRRPRQRARRGALPPHLVDRRGGQPRRPVHRGRLRGRTAAHDAYHRTKYESEKLVRERASRSRGGCTGRRSSSATRKTGEMDKIDGPYYVFKAIQKARDALPQWFPLVALESAGPTSCRSTTSRRRSITSRT